jgi:site-specific recombinase XerD
MKKASAFSSVLAPVIEDYLKLRRALGKDCNGEEWIFRHLDDFLYRVHGDLTPEHFKRWCLTQEHLASGVRRDRMRNVRNLCIYRRRRAPDCFVPDLFLFPPPHQPVLAHIFTEDEIALLLRQTDSLSSTSRSPLRPQTYRLTIVLLYTTGLRRGELVRLKIRDYDSSQRTLLIRESKFHKSRLLPLSSDAAREIETYLVARRALALPSSRETPLLWNGYKGGKAYTGGGVGTIMRVLFRTTGIRTQNGRLPRTHDVRHSFAHHALLRWYRAGCDVQAKLPFLAAYMGHVSIVSTERYLHLVNQMVDCASDRFAACCGALVTPPPTTGGGQ